MVRNDITQNAPHIPHRKLWGHGNYSTTCPLSREKARCVPTQGPQGMTAVEGLKPQLLQRTVRIIEEKKMKLGNKLNGPLRPGLLLKGREIGGMHSEWSLRHEGTCYYGWLRLTFFHLYQISEVKKCKCSSCSRQILGWVWIRTSQLQGWVRLWGAHPGELQSTIYNLYYRIT